METPSGEAISAWKQQYVTEFYFSKIDTEIRYIENYVGQGKCKDFAEYSKMAGKIQALKLAKGLINVPTE